jgi:hypothetical protein
LPDREWQAAVVAFETLHGRLTAAGIPPGPAGQLAFELLEELLADPPDAAAFLAALSAVPDGGAQPAPPAGKRGRHVRRGGRR